MQEFYNYKFREEGLSPKTLRNYHMALHKCLQQAVKERLLVYNPCDAVTLPSGEKPEVVVFTNDQQRALVQVRCLAIEACSCFCFWFSSSTTFCLS